MAGIVVLGLWIAGTAFRACALPAIIPEPAKMEARDGEFKLLRSFGAVGGTARQVAVGIVAGEAASKPAADLAWKLSHATGVPFRVERHPSRELAAGKILFTTNGAAAGLGPEGYMMTVTREAVVIRAPTEAGLFYGEQTLLQLLPVEIFGTKPAKNVEWVAPCVEIEDRPRFKWRGFMLDVSRHFFKKEEVERILDVMALHKMNSFHWHLTDDQGWRIEIKKYPKLTDAGAWRTNIGFGLDPKLGTAYGPDGRYGGYYTQDQIREVVAYAKERHINIVPEIEMPGHASAALKAYPQFSCTGGPFTTDLPGGVFNGIYCAGNEAAFSFVEDVLDEVCALFPGKYIHVGGDEVPTDNWKQCEQCQARMKQEGLKTEPELESYFMRRVEKMLNARHHTLIGWSEIREGGLAQNAAIMDWVGGATEAAMAGHDVVMAPLADCYFDHYQSTNQAAEPHSIGGYLPLHQVYNFEPIPTNLPPQFQAHILGAQANEWTEYMPSLKHVEYMAFPRLCALAEVLWTPRDRREWNDFKRRVEVDSHRLDQLGVNYRHASITSPDADAPP